MPLFRTGRVVSPLLNGFRMLTGLALLMSAAPAASYSVASLMELQDRVHSAAAGDVIVLKNGVYTTERALVVDRSGSADAPITIAAETTGEVEIRGTDGIVVEGGAAHVVIAGFVFTHASGRTVVQPGATHVRFTRNIFECAGGGAYLTVAGDDTQIDGNTFRHKRTVGNMIDVRGAGSQVAQRVWIHHNSFHDFAPAGANGAETIRFGLSGLSLSAGHGLIEHNLFVRCVGENELISNKSGANTYRYNTFVDSPGAQLTLRHGNDCLVYGNYFRNTDGIRIFGDRHRVFSNYLEGNTTGITIGNGGAEVADGAPLTSHDRPDDCVISFNTLVENGTHYLMLPRAQGIGATNTTFSHNVIRGGGVVADLRGPYPGGSWENNILWNTGEVGAMPPSGYTVQDRAAATAASGLHLSPPTRPALPARP